MWSGCEGEVVGGGRSGSGWIEMYSVWRVVGGMGGFRGVAESGVKVCVWNYVKSVAGVLEKVYLPISLCTIFSRPDLFPDICGPWA